MTNIKKLTLTIIALITLSISSNSFAADAPEGTYIIDVGVKGMVCDFCARSLEKVFAEHKQVKSIDVSLDDAAVKVFVKEGEELSDETIAQVIEYSGYTLDGIERAE